MNNYSVKPLFGKEVSLTRLTSVIAFLINQ